MKHRGNKSERQLRAGQLIKIAIIDVLTKMKMPDLRLSSSNVIVTDVSVSPDLKFATCYVRLLNLSATGLLQSAEDLLEALEESKYFIRKWVTSAVKLKYSPEISFEYDHSIDKLHKLEQLLAADELRKKSNM